MHRNQIHQPGRLSPFEGLQDEADLLLLLKRDSGTPERHRAYASAGRREDRVGDSRPRRKERRFAQAGWRVVVGLMALSMTDSDFKCLLRSACRQLLNINELDARKGSPDKLIYLRVELGVQHR